MRRLVVLFGGCALILFSCFAGIVGGYVGSRLGNGSNLNSIAGITQDLKVTNQQEANIEVANKASNSVVSIVVSQQVSNYEKYRNDPFLQYFGQNNTDTDPNATTLTEVAAGSGFVISEDGMIITNRHVVDTDNAEYTVIFNNDKKYTAKVLAKDTLLDIAFLKIDATGLTPLTFGNSSEIKVGQSVVAIGNALGEFSNTVSAGIISGVNRQITATDEMGNSSEELYNVLQTDASINSGNSGGPLLDLNGNVIGVNVAVASNAQSIGFAIPSNVVVDLLARLKADGAIIRPKLGVRFRMIDADLKKANNLTVDEGALIQKGTAAADVAIVAGSAAEKAGLKEGDIIEQVDDIKLTSNNPLNIVIQGFRVGDVVTLKVLRDGQEIEIKATLEK